MRFARGTWTANLDLAIIITTLVQIIKIGTATRVIIILCQETTEVEFMNTYSQQIDAKTFLALVIMSAIKASAIKNVNRVINKKKIRQTDAMVNFVKSMKTANPTNAIVISV